MPRYAKANQTIKSLKALIKKSTDQAYLNDSGEGCPYGILNGHDAVQKQVSKDLSKIDVDFENTEYISEYHDLPGVKSLEDFEMIGSDAGAFPVAWCVCCGDWEYPLAFVLYIGQEGELRAYIPKDGNVYNKKTKTAYGNNDGDPEFEADIFDDVTDPLLQFDADKLRADVAGQIEVKDADKKKIMNVNGNVTFRQLIQSLRDFEDQYASLGPVAEGAEDPAWGIAYIWFENGVLNIGQYDDEGDSCGRVADGIENCVPADRLDEVAVVRIGVGEEENGKVELYDPYGGVSVKHTVKSSVVKTAEEDDWFCEWVLEFEDEK